MVHFFIDLESSQSVDKRDVIWRASVWNVFCQL